MNDNSFTLEPVKAREIAGVLYREYKKGEGPFENSGRLSYELPQGMIEGSKVHSLYLTYIFTLDQSTRSEELWSQARQFYQETPWFFDAEQILTRSDEGLSKALTILGISDTSTSVKRWKAISKILLEDYSGDPRRIADKTRDPVVVRKRIGEILGTKENGRIRRYQQLMTASRLLKVTKPESLGVFTDEYIAVFTLCTGVLRFEGELFEGSLDADPILSLTRKAWNEATMDMGVPALELEDAISVVSRSLCPERKCIICPIYQKCEKRFRLEISGKKIRLSATSVGVANQMQFCSSCGRELMRNSRFCDGCGIVLRRKSE